MGSDTRKRRRLEAARQRPRRGQRGRRGWTASANASAAVTVAAGIASALGAITAAIAGFVADVPTPDESVNAVAILASTILAIAVVLVTVVTLAIDWLRAAAAHRREFHVRDITDEELRRLIDTLTASRGEFARLLNNSGGKEELR